MPLPITVQWNTHTQSGGSNVFGLNTKQKFQPQPLDNVLDQGQFDNINPNKFRGKRTHGELNFRQDDNTEWENNISWAGAGSPPQANYQGTKVNFSQPTNAQFTGLVQEVGKINQSIFQYPQQSNLASAKSDTDIWNHINRYIWGKSGSQSSPKGNWSADPNAIIPTIRKNIKSIELLHNENISLGDSQAAAKIHRDLLESKIQSHSHNGGTGKDCGWFGEKCWFKDLLPNIPSTAILAAVGIGGYMLLKDKK